MMRKGEGRGGGGSECVPCVAKTGPCALSPPPFSPLGTDRRRVHVACAAAPPAPDARGPWAPPEGVDGTAKPVISP